MQELARHRPEVCNVQPLWHYIATWHGSTNQRYDVVEYLLTYLGRHDTDLNPAIECFLMTNPDALVLLFMFANNYGIMTTMVRQACHWITQPSIVRGARHFPACIVALVPPDSRISLFNAVVELLCVVLLLAQRGETQCLNYLQECRNACSFWRHVPPRAEITPSALVRILVLAVQMPVYWVEVVEKWYAFLSYATSRSGSATVNHCLQNRDWFTLTPEQRALVGSTLHLELPAEQVQQEISLTDAARAILYDT